MVLTRRDALKLGLGMSFVPLAGPAFGQDVNTIMRRVDDRPEGDTAELRLTMILEDRRGNRRERRLRSFRKTYADREALTLFVESPQEVAGTAFLSIDPAGVGSPIDAWLYLPAMNRTRRVASSNQSDNFMGSDFTFSDIIGLEIWDWDYEIESTSADVGGHDCWVITSTPKPEAASRVDDETGYSARRIWVRKDNAFVVRGEFTERTGGTVKLMLTNNVRRIGGIWTPDAITMATTRGGNLLSRSTIRFDEARYDMTLADNLFTPDALVRGIR